MRYLLEVMLFSFLISKRTRLASPLLRSPRPSILPSTTSLVSPRYIGKKARGRRQREKHRAQALYQNRVREQKNLLRLHPASQWKRILSACDYWFSNTNLVNDEFLRTELKNNDGYCRVKTLTTFPKFRHWVTPKLLVEAIENAGPRFQLKRHPTNPAPEKALVRRKGVTLEHVKIMELNPEWFEKTDGEEEKEKRAKARRKQRALKNYNTKHEIVVVKGPRQLAILCDKLRTSISKSVKAYGTNDASVLGLDVEFATLELDIRPRLPAMLQLSAPNGPVGLIWLDKFPNHGRDILNDSEYAPLASLLADFNILKVGLSVEADARSLASWWGINDREYVGHFISGTQDLADMRELIPYLPTDGDSDAQMSRLSDLCAVVLKRDLVKTKSRKEDKKKSHWRAPVLLDRMKSYAANDAACAVDIWMKLKLQSGKKKEAADDDAELDGNDTEAYSRM